MALQDVVTQALKALQDGLEAHPLPKGAAPDTILRGVDLFSASPAEALAVVEQELVSLGGADPQVIHLHRECVRRLRQAGVRPPEWQEEEE